MPSDPPEPPDPRETSAAQTGTSISTAIANAMMGNVGRVGPGGTTQYKQSGSYQYTDPYTGQTYAVPTFDEHVTLSPEQQKTYDRTQAAEYNLADLAAQQSGFLKDYMGKPVDINNEETEARLHELGSARLDPRFAREEEGLRTQLLNRGIREGSDAWSAAMGQFGQNKNDAYNQLLLSGRAQSVQEQLAERNQPLNEISALLSGAQVEVPEFSSIPQPNIPTTDVAGLVGENYRGRLANWQQENSFMNSILGGLFSLGAAGIMASDERVKDDIEEVGETHDGQPIFTFRYKGSPLLQMGLLAQDVEKRKPGAVIEIGGVKMVDYPRALENA